MAFSERFAITSHTMAMPYIPTVPFSPDTFFSPTGGMAYIDNKRAKWYPANNAQKDTPMANSLNLSLTDELRAFIDKNSGDGTLYATPSEFVRDILRRHKAQEEAALVRDAIIEGYQDAIAGRTAEFKGNLKTLLKKAKK